MLMKELDGPVQARRTSHHATESAIQVICLGSGGGPIEDNVTGFLVRSVASKWAKNSVLAVDAGSHLAAITRILQNDFPLVSHGRPVPRPRNGNSRDFDSSPSPGTTGQPSDVEYETDSRESSDQPEPPPTVLEVGPFAGLPFPHASARANALHVVREHVSTYLITHPHLDHVSGFVVNTAAFHTTSRPKRVAALPFTVNAIKTHMFNNIVWPNLTDEDGGVGLVTFQRLTEGGNLALGEGSGRGYIEVVDGLGVKGFKISHGHCMRGPSHVHRGSNANVPDTAAPSLHHASSISHHTAFAAPEGREGRSLSFSLPSQPGTPLFPGNAAASDRAATAAAAQYEQCVIDSSAYFIRTESSHHSSAREILMFGDVEPDSISLSPRTHIVWAEAAPKIANGTLRGIFIECSYNNSQGDGMLYGHLNPRHLIAELQNLAAMVQEAKKDLEKEEEWRKGRKRKRASNGLLSGSTAGIPPETVAAIAMEGTSRKSSRTRSYKEPVANVDKGGDEIMTDLGAPSPNPQSAASITVPVPQAPQQAVLPHPPSPTHYSQQASHGVGHHSYPSAPAAVSLSTVPAEVGRATLAAGWDAPLKDVRVVIIHVKDTMTDGELVGEGILRELTGLEEGLEKIGKGLGCVFDVARSGAEYWF